MSGHLQCRLRARTTACMGWPLYCIRKVRLACTMPYRLCFTWTRHRHSRPASPLASLAPAPPGRWRACRTAPTERTRHPRDSKLGRTGPPALSRGCRAGQGEAGAGAGACQERGQVRSKVRREVGWPWLAPACPGRSITGARVVSMLPAPPAAQEAHPGQQAAPSSSQGARSPWLTGGHQR